MDDDDFAIENLNIEIRCPKCDNEMAHDDNSLPLAESPRGVMLECGSCAEISQWELSPDQKSAKQVPVTWGGNL